MVNHLECHLESHCPRQMCPLMEGTISLSFTLLHHKFLDWKMILYFQPEDK